MKRSLADQQREAAQLRSTAVRGLALLPLCAIYTQQRDVRAYVALCERSELSVQDCLAVATMLKTRRQRDEALAWVDRGLAVEKGHPHGSTAGHDLAKLKRELLTKLGRRRDALEEAWAEFREDPSTFSHEELENAKRGYRAGGGSEGGRCPPPRLRRSMIVSTSVCESARCVTSTWP